MTIFDAAVEYAIADARRQQESRRRRTPAEMLRRAAQASVTMQYHMATGARFASMREPDIASAPMSAMGSSYRHLRRRGGGRRRISTITCRCFMGFIIWLRPGRPSLSTYQHTQERELDISALGALLDDQHEPRSSSAADFRNAEICEWEIMSGAATTIISTRGVMHRHHYNIA